MFKFTLIILFISIQVYSQTFNSSELICNEPYYKFANATFKDNFGNEYLVYSIQDEIHHEFTINLQKWDKNDVKVFADCGITVLKFNQEVVTDSISTYFYNYPISANIQVDDSSNIYVLLNISYGKGNIDSLFYKSDITAYKLDELGNQKWSPSGVLLFSKVKNAIIENFEITSDGNLHILETSSDFLNSISVANYFSLDENGNKRYESTQSRFVDRSLFVPVGYLRDYYLFKTQDTIFISDFAYNSTTDFTVKTRKYNSLGSYTENSLNLFCDSNSLNRIDIKEENVFLISQNALKGEIRDFSLSSGFAISPKYILDQMPAEISSNNQYLYYATSDSLNFVSHIQKTDSLGNKYFSTGGYPVKQNLANWIEISSGNDFLFYSDGSLGYVNTFNTLKGTSSGYLTYLKINNSNMLIQKEAGINDQCASGDNEYLIKAFVDQKDNSLNLYYGLNNWDLVRMNFYKVEVAKPSACPPISAKVNRN